VTKTLYTSAKAGWLYAGLLASAIFLGLAQMGYFSLSKWGALGLQLTWLLLLAALVSSHIRHFRRVVGANIGIESSVALGGVWSDEATDLREHDEFGRLPLHFRWSKCSAKLERTSHRVS
jgi:hypothetical protein